MKKMVIQTLVPSPMPSAAFHANAALGRLVEQAANPYHALHIAKAFHLTTPKLDHKVPSVVMTVGNPWEMMEKK